MPFVKRDNQGIVRGMYSERQADAVEYLDDDHADVHGFVQSMRPTKPRITHIKGAPNIQRLADKLNEILTVLENHGMVSKEE